MTQEQDEGVGQFARATPASGIPGASVEAIAALPACVHAYLQHVQVEKRAWLIAPMRSTPSI